MGPLQEPHISMAPHQANMNTGPKKHGFFVASVLQTDRGDRHTCCRDVGGTKTPPKILLFYGLDGSGIFILWVKHAI